MDISLIDQAKDLFESKVEESYKKWISKPLSETDTRCKLIDSILKDVLGWKEDLIEREPRTIENGTYIDYVISTTHPYLIIEAKNNQIDFELPDSLTKKKYKVGGVLSENKELKKAMIQARDYAVSKGITFCCVTNGYQFVFFRSQNSEGVPWVDHQAVIFYSFQDIAEHFKQFYYLLSYEGVSLGLLQKNLPISESSEGSLKRFQMFSYSHNKHLRTRERNQLFPHLREIIRRVFQNIDSEDNDTEILEHCYVESPRDSSYGKGLGDLLKDQSSLLSKRSQKINIGKKEAGTFQKDLNSSIGKTNPISEVLLILGGVGAGKTTFIQRFRKVLAKDEIENSCLWAYINFNKLSGAGENLLDWVTDQIMESLNRDYPNIEFESWEMLKQIYHSEYNKLQKGYLAPLWRSDKNKFEEKFSEKLLEYSDNNEKHLIRTLNTISNKLDRRIFLVFDNADQFDADTQNKVFLIAQKLAEELRCSSIISLREESYWKNKDYGALSAFHSISYHVQAPRLEQVISKRFKYAKKLLLEDHSPISSNPIEISQDELKEVFDLLSATVLGEDKRYIEAMEYLSPGEVRRPLEFIARFLYSGHTNMNSLLKAVRENRKLTIGFHEYLTSIILGDHEYFTDENSDITNIFAIDGFSDASHFNRITVIGRILNSKSFISEIGLGFSPIKQVIADCERIGLLPETTSSILTLLIRRRILQTETQIRDDISSSEYIRATSASLYYISKLCHEFAYLDTIILDTPIGNTEYFENLQRITNNIEKESNRLHRLNFRLERTKLFIEYLATEFSTSSLIKFDDIIDKSVLTLISNMLRSYKEHRKQIFKAAKSLLS